MSRYLIGIDLGTTNSALAYVDLEHATRAGRLDIRPFAVDVAAFETTLRAAGREVEIHRYPGTGHWFAEPSKDAYVPAAAELAFDRTVDYLGRTLANV